jgi:hypothetical protein
MVCVLPELPFQVVPIMRKAKGAPAGRRPSIDRRQSTID